MDREQVVQDYRRRIAAGERIKLTKAERAFLVDEFVGRLMGMTAAADVEAACREELDLIEEGFGSGTNSAINYLSDYRKAVAAAVDAGRLPMGEETTVRTVGQRRATGEPFEAINHLAWSLLRYDNSIYLAAREETNRGNNARQDHPQPFVPARFLAKAGELLDSSEAEALAVGIAALTGRRHTEVAVSGQFSLTQHPYVLQFRGQLKKGLVQTRELLEFSIGTLLPAIEVMAAIERFRAMPGVQEMAGRSSDDPLVVNFRARVNSRVKQHFQRTGVLPLLPGFKSVSVHRLRAAYARMLVYFWLPNQGANEQRFLQFYLGHVEADLMATAANSASTNHYFGYRLVGEDDKPILASGVKLMAFPPLPNPTDSQITEQMRSNQQLDGLEGLEADAGGGAGESEALGAGATRAAARADRGTTQEDQAAADAAVHQPAELEESSSAPTELVTALAQLLDELPVKGAPGGSGRLQTALQPQQPVSAAQPRATPSTMPAAPLDELGPLDDQLHRLHQADQAVALSSGPAARSGASQSSSQAAPAQVAPSDLPLAALLDQMQALQLQLSLSQAERQSIMLLSNQVEELKGQLQIAQQERDQAQNQLQQVDNLQQENIQLKAQLHDAQQRLDLFLNLAHGLPLPIADQAAISEATAAPPAPVQATTLASSPSTTSPLPLAHPVSPPPPQSQQPITTTPISNQPPATPPLPPLDDDQLKALAAGLSPDDRIPLAIQALVEFNQQCSQTKDRWTITGNVIASMSSTNAATRVNPWLDDHPDVVAMIHHHNQSMGIDSNYHNRGKGKDKGQLRQILAWFLNQRQKA